MPRSGCPPCFRHSPAGWSSPTSKDACVKLNPAVTEITGQARARRSACRCCVAGRHDDAAFQQQLLRRAPRREGNARHVPRAHGEVFPEAICSRRAQSQGEPSGAVSSATSSNANAPRIRFAASRLGPLTSSPPARVRVGCNTPLRAQRAPAPLPWCSSICATSVHHDSLGTHGDSCCEPWATPATTRAHEDRWRG